MESLPVRFSPDSRQFLTTSVDSSLGLEEAGRIQVWEVVSGDAKITIPLPARRYTMRFYQTLASDEPASTRTTFRIMASDGEIVFRPDSRRLAVAIPTEPPPYVPSPIFAHRVVSKREIRVRDRTKVGSCFQRINVQDSRVLPVA